MINQVNMIHAIRKLNKGRIIQEYFVMNVVISMVLFLVINMV
jgi:hypothetical protein